MTDPEQVSISPLKPWQWAELTGFLLVIAVQVWLYRVSVVVAAAWGLLVPVLAIHLYTWMAPLVRQRHADGRADDPMP